MFKLINHTLHEVYIELAPPAARPAPCHLYRIFLYRTFTVYTNVLGLEPDRGRVTDHLKADTYLIK